MNTGSPRVFFSYSRTDAEFVLRLASDLRAAGVNLWIDQLDIAAGDRWDRAVEEALEEAPCLLAVLSPTSVASQNVMDEVSFALEKNKKIVPVLHQTCDIPFRLRRLHYIDFTVEYDKALAQLVTTLNKQPAAAVTSDPHIVRKEAESGPGTTTFKADEAKTVVDTTPSLIDPQKGGAATDQKKPIPGTPEVPKPSKKLSLSIIFTLVFLFVATGGSLFFFLVSNNGKSGIEKKAIVPQAQDNAAVIDGRLPESRRPAVATSSEALPFFMTRPVTEEDMRDKSVWELDVMRNEIYARYGRRFNRSDLQNYFNGQPWYRPQYPSDQFPDSLLTPTQKNNIDRILRYQQRHK